MIITKGANCSNLTITSTLITQYAASTSSYTSIVLRITKNCCSETLNVNINSATTNYVLTPATYGVTEFEDGIYNLEIVLTATNGTVSKDSNCTFINCKTICNIGKYLADNKDPFVFYYYQFLISAEQCEDCSCFYMCKLYNNLLNILNDSDLSLCNPCSSC